MTDYVEVNGQSIEVVGYKYIVENDGAGLDKYPLTQYRGAEKETIKRLAEEDDEITVTGFEAIVSIEDVRKVFDDD